MHTDQTSCPAESTPALSPSPRGLFQTRLLVALAVAVAFLAGVVTNQIAFDGSSKASSSLVDQPQFATVQEVWDLVHSEYVDPDLIDDTTLLYGAARGMVDSLGDTGHSSFLDPHEAEAFRAALSGELIGLGLHLEYLNRQPVVVAPVHGSPAQEAGIQTDDIIVEIDGVSTFGMSETEVSQHLRGEEDTEVTLTIERPANSSTFSVTIVRARITLDPLSWAELPNGMALVQIHEFSTGAAEQLREALVEISTREANQGIVLDLRNNPGGLVSEAVGVASEFMREGATIYLHEPRHDEPQAVTTIGTEGRGYDVPLVVLINRGSASASEIVSSALRDNGRATLVGERSYGTGTVVSTYDLDDGAAIALGIAFWKTPTGELAWKVGIEPDLEVAQADRSEVVTLEDGTRHAPFSLDQLGDLQLKAAIEALQSRITANQ